MRTTRTPHAPTSSVEGLLVSIKGQLGALKGSCGVLVGLRKTLIWHPTSHHFGHHHLTTERSSWCFENLLSLQCIPSLNVFTRLFPRLMTCNRVMVHTPSLYAMSPI